MGRRKRIARNVVQMGPDKLARVCEQSPVLAQIDPLKRRSRQLEHTAVPLDGQSPTRGSAPRPGP
jgi:hypothetical protein